VVHQSNSSSSSPHGHVDGRNLHVDVHKLHVDVRNLHVDGRNLHVDGRNLHIDVHKLHWQEHQFVMIFFPLIEGKYGDSAHCRVAKGLAKLPPYLSQLFPFWFFLYYFYL
jgi:hypothetical protein